MDIGIIMICNSETGSKDTRNKICLMDVGVKKKVTNCNLTPVIQN
jgi:hypothetical protein